MSSLVLTVINQSSLVHEALSTNGALWEQHYVIKRRPFCVDVQLTAAAANGAAVPPFSVVAELHYAGDFVCSGEPGRVVEHVSRIPLTYTGLPLPTPASSFRLDCQCGVLSSQHEEQSFVVRVVAVDPQSKQPLPDVKPACSQPIKVISKPAVVKKQLAARERRVAAAADPLQALEAASRKRRQALVEGARKKKTAAGKTTGAPAPKSGAASIIDEVLLPARGTSASGRVRVSSASSSSSRAAAAVRRGRRSAAAAAADDDDDDESALPAMLPAEFDATDEFDADDNNNDADYDNNDADYDNDSNGNRRRRAPTHRAGLFGYSGSPLLTSDEDSNHAAADFNDDDAPSDEEVELAPASASMPASNASLYAMLCEVHRMQQLQLNLMQQVAANNRPASSPSSSSLLDSTDCYLSPSQSSSMLAAGAGAGATTTTAAAAVALTSTLTSQQPTSVHSSPDYLPGSPASSSADFAASAVSSALSQLVSAVMAQSPAQRVETVARALKTVRAHASSQAEVDEALRAVAVASVHASTGSDVSLFGGNPADTAAADDDDDASRPYWVMSSSLQLPVDGLLTVSQMFPSH